MYEDIKLTPLIDEVKYLLLIKHRQYLRLRQLGQRYLYSHAIQKAFSLPYALSNVQDKSK